MPISRRISKKKTCTIKSGIKRSPKALKLNVMPKTVGYKSTCNKTSQELNIDALIAAIKADTVELNSLGSNDAMKRARESLRGSGIISRNGKLKHPYDGK